MRAIRCTVTLSLLALVLACASVAPAPVREALAPTGTLRIGVYPGSPTSMVSEAALTEARGLSVDVGVALARSLGVPASLVVLPRAADVVNAIKNNAADFTITNASPARARDVDFSQTVVSLELGFLAAAASAVSSIEDIDRNGVRVGVTQGSTSQSTLGARLINATIVAVPSVNDAAAQLRAGAIDVFATNKAVLHEMSGQVPNARVLSGAWGVEHLAAAIPKARGETAQAWLKRFIDAQITNGAVARAAQRAELRGLAAP